MEEACIFKIASSWQLMMITGQLLEVVTWKNMEIVVNMKVKGNLNNMSFDMSHIAHEPKFL